LLASDGIHSSETPFKSVENEVHQQAFYFLPLLICDANNAHPVLHPSSKRGARLLHQSRQWAPPLLDLLERLEGNPHPRLNIGESELVLLPDFAHQLDQWMLPSEARERRVLSHMPKCKGTRRECQPFSILRRSTYTKFASIARHQARYQLTPAAFHPKNAATFATRDAPVLVVYITCQPQPDTKPYPFCRIHVVQIHTERCPSGGKHDNIRLAVV